MGVQDDVMVISRETLALSDPVTLSMVMATGATVLEYCTALPPPR